VTTIDQGPRIVLLRTLAAMRDYELAHPADTTERAGWPTHVPLFGASDWPYDGETMKRAAREAAAMGHLHLTHPPGIYGDLCWGMLRLTDAGYDHFKAHDAIGEDAHETLRRSHA
jgi:hypothetical protein